MYTHWPIPQYLSLVLPQVCLGHFPDTVSLCGCGEGAAGVSVCVHMCVKGWGLLEPHVRLLSPDLSMYVPLFVNACGVCCLCVSLLGPRIRSRVSGFLSNLCPDTFQPHKALLSPKIFTGDQEYQPESDWELLLSWQTDFQNVTDLFRVIGPSSDKVETEISAVRFLCICQCYPSLGLAVCTAPYLHRGQAGLGMCSL